MKRFVWISTTLLLMGILACTFGRESNDAAQLSTTNVVETNSEVSILAALPSSATVDFGNPKGGTRQARHSLVPRTVVISVNGSVTYNIGGRHQPAIYAPGTKPNDINPSGGLVNDSNNRIVLGPLQVGGSWTTPVGTFSVPGRYLVICNITSHFFDEDMYGWVIVEKP